jgi:hypothetical protein
MDAEDCDCPFVLLLNSVDGRGRQYFLLQSVDEVVQRILDMCETEVIEKRTAEAVERKQAPPNIVQYDIATILNFVDTRLLEVVVLAMTEPGKYSSHGKTWLKKAAVDFLLRNVEHGADED